MAKAPGAVRFGWVLDTAELEPGGVPPLTQPYLYSIVIRGDKINRDLAFYIYAPPPGVMG